jgi:hypothetical protein
VEPCPPDYARSAADPDDALIARLAAIASVVDPVPPALYETAGGLFDAASLARPSGRISSAGHRSEQ